MTLRRLLWRRGQARATLGSAACHYTTEQVARTVADLGRLRLRGTVVLRVLAGTAAGLELAFQLGDALFVPAIKVSIGKSARRYATEIFFQAGIPTMRCGANMRCLLCFHLVVGLLERVDFSADQFDLLDVTADCGQEISTC